MVFFTFIRSTGLFQPDECLEILQSVDDALADATKFGNDPLDQDTAVKEGIFESAIVKQEEKSIMDKGETVMARIGMGRF